jgi:predicted RNA binding protein YcfA (HicA-like mRNA interferase family)
MKKRDLEMELKSLGWFLKKQGGNHEIWENGRGDMQPIPRHNEIKEHLAKAIIKAARLNPGK